MVENGPHGTPNAAGTPKTTAAFTLVSSPIASVKDREGLLIAGQAVIASLADRVGTLKFLADLMKSSGEEEKLGLETVWQA